MKKSNKPIDVAGERGQELAMLQGKKNQLNALLQITRSLSSELNLAKLLQRITTEVKKVLDADRCTVFLYDAAKDELWSKVATGVRREIRFPADKGIAGSVFKSGEIINIPDAYLDERFNPEIDKKTGYRTTSILCLPMQNKMKEIIGVFQVLNKKNGGFTGEDEILLSAIALIASSAIENAQLYEEQKRSFLSFIETLATTLDTRDYITAGHSRRVALYTNEIARIMKLEITTREMLYYASLLHDIGKLGVPEIVLFKDRKLTEDEYEIIKGHAVITKNILKKIHFPEKFQDIPQIASSHHERIDGSGYPEGLRGDQIPLGSKIMALADAFDAMTSRRQFQDRMDLEKIMHIIDTETGTAFEPYVVYNFKFISLNRLILILEYGHTSEIDKNDLTRIKDFTLRDIVDIRGKSGKSDQELEIENIFMRYYLRQYRTD
jgi:putative nucleotidyltransferase with HDIG domain